MFVLLDLIGHKSVQFPNFFDQTTGKYYNRLRDIGLLFPQQFDLIDNSFFVESGLFRSYTANKLTAPSRPVFTSHIVHGGIEDDHIPFLHLGNSKESNSLSKIYSFRCSNSSPNLLSISTCMA